MGNVTCKVEDCDRAPLARGWCNAHYQRVLKYGDAQADRPLRALRKTRVDEGICAIGWCDKPALRRGWCCAHYQRWKQYGDPEAGRAMKGSLSSRPCKAKPCDAVANGGLGWCKRHYQKYYLTGDPLTPDKHTRRGATLRERIEAKVVKTDHCWFWTGRPNRDGYGVIGITENGRKKNHMAHRASYEAFVGPIPHGMVIDHLCRNRACVRPEHLEPVLHEVNVRRGASTERGTHCGNGHEFTKANTRWVRVCITCSDAARGRWKARKAA